MRKPKTTSEVKPHYLIEVEGATIDVRKVSDELYLKALTLGMRVLYARGDLPTNTYTKD
jgi:hypothetical protein